MLHCRKVLISVDREVLTMLVFNTMKGEPNTMQCAFRSHCNIRI